MQVSRYTPPLLFPDKTALELRKAELEAIELALLEKKWRLEGLEGRIEFTKKQEAELRQLRGLSQRLFDIRYSFFYANWSQRNEAKSSD